MAMREWRPPIFHPDTPYPILYTTHHTPRITLHPPLHTEPCPHCALSSHNHTHHADRRQNSTCRMVRLRPSAPRRIPLTNDHSAGHEGRGGQALYHCPRVCCAMPTPTPIPLPIPIHTSIPTPTPTPTPTSPPLTPAARARRRGSTATRPSSRTSSPPRRSPTSSRRRWYARLPSHAPPH
jgi:hypothetical protein